MMDKLELSRYFPDDLEIIGMEQGVHLTVHMRSVSKTCICPHCGSILGKMRGTYRRTVQDLPILGHGVRLKLQAKEYLCDNVDCPAKSVSESFDGFLSRHSRLTDRCSKFICKLALGTNCEAASRLLKQIGIQKTGCSIVHLLLKEYATMESEPCGATVGIDDFALRKGQRYGTIVVDEQSRRPLALLDGRDGATLKEWLRKNQQITTVTRDRSGAYSSAIKEILPDAIQIADRFHLHHNLMQAVKDALAESMPSRLDLEHVENSINIQTSTEMDEKRELQSTES